MPDLNFSIASAVASPFAAIPTLDFSLHVSSIDPTISIHTVVLRTQIRIDPQRRSYDPQEKQSLGDLFGTPSRWGQTLRPMLWTHVTTVVPSFTGQTIAALPVPCTFDFNVAATKYFDGLDAGEIPLNFLFSGTIFYADNDGSLQVTQISWEKESRFSIPIETWKQMMDLYYPNSAWLRLHKDAFNCLYDYKTSHSLPTWEAAIEKLVAEQQVKT